MAFLDDRKDYHREIEEINHEECEDANEWKKVSRKYKNKEKTGGNLKCYWNGFDEKGRERWYIEFSNGSIISNKDPNYDFWSKKFYQKKNSLS